MSDTQRIVLHLSPDDFLAFGFAIGSGIHRAEEDKAASTKMKEALYRLADKVHAAAAEER